MNYQTIVSLPSEQVKSRYSGQQDLESNHRNYFRLDYLEVDDNYLGDEILFFGNSKGHLKHKRVLEGINTSYWCKTLSSLIAKKSKVLMSDDWKRRFQLNKLKDDIIKENELSCETLLVEKRIIYGTNDIDDDLDMRSRSDAMPGKDVWYFSLNPRSEKSFSKNQYPKSKSKRNYRGQEDSLSRLWKI
ncbi:hypothetical protein LIER_09359 [Lithospermum erythrorhizon]|uniref:Ycf1 n=1 Tax=Lithospermum erythrorhizon TaxID=34254 RepID=A0AAV3PI98_LITER